MENKLQKINKENNKLANYQSLQIELSKILENQRIGKKKQDQILVTTVLSSQSCAWKFSFQKLKIILMNQKYHKLFIRNQKK